MNPVVQLGGYSCNRRVDDDRIRANEPRQHPEPAFRHRAGSIELDEGVYNESVGVRRDSDFSPAQRAVSGITETSCRLDQRPAGRPLKA